MQRLMSGGLGDMPPPVSQLPPKQPPAGSPRHQPVANQQQMQPSQQKPPTQQQQQQQKLPAASGSGPLPSAVKQPAEARHDTTPHPATPAVNGEAQRQPKTTERDKAMPKQDKEAVAVTPSKDIKLAPKKGTPEQIITAPVVKDMKKTESQKSRHHDVSSFVSAYTA